MLPGVFTKPATLPTSTIRPRVSLSASMEALISRAGPSTLVSTISDQPAGSPSATESWVAKPALATTVSRRPNSFSVVSTASATWACSAALPRIVSRFAGSPSSSANARSLASPRPVTATRCPASSSRRATAAPMPPPALGFARAGGTPIATGDQRDRCVGHGSPCFRSCVSHGQRGVHHLERSRSQGPDSDRPHRRVHGVRHQHEQVLAAVHARLVRGVEQPVQGGEVVGVEPLADALAQPGQ